MKTILRAQPRLLPALAAVSLLFAPLAASAPAGDTFVLDILGINGSSPTTVNWNAAAWDNTTDLDRTGGFPNDGQEIPLGSDVITVNFLSNGGSTDMPQLDLEGINRTIQVLNFTEDPTSGRNADANFVSSGNATLTLREINYLLGGREIDFFNTITVADVAGDGLALNITADSTIDFHGPVTGSEGITFGAAVGTGGDGNRTFRNYQVQGDITNHSIDGDIRFGFDTTAAPVVHNVVNLNLSDNDVLHNFYRSAGSNLATVNIDNINMAGLVTLRIGSASAANGAAEATVNLNGEVVFDQAATATFLMASQFAGVVNLNDNLKQQQSATPELLTLSGDGWLNVLADFQDLAGNQRTGTVRIDGTRGLTVFIDNESRLGAGAVEVRSGGSLRFGYDVFVDGYPGSAITNISGTSTGDNSGGVVLGFDAVQSGFFDPMLDDGAGGKVALRVRSFNGITGNLTNAVYSGAGQNIVFERDAVLGPISGGAGPTRSELTNGLLWQALTGNDQVVTDIGDDGVGIFQGVAFNPLVHNGTAVGFQDSNGIADSVGGFHGSLTARAGVDLEVLVASNTRFSEYDTTFAQLHSTTGVANFRGPKELHLEGTSSAGAWQGSVTIINRIGEDGSGADNSQNRSILRIGGTDGIADGQTVNVTHGRIILEDTAAIDPGATLNVGQGALLDFAASSSAAPAAGDVNILPGGGILWNNSQLFNISGSSEWTVAPGTILVLDGDQNLDLPALQGGDATNPNLAASMDWVLQDADADIISGAPLRLGQGRRITGFASSSADLQATSTDVQALDGVDFVIFAAVQRIAANNSGGSTTAQTLSFDNRVFLPDTDLQIGDLGTFETVVGSTSLDTRREVVAQTGLVRLDGVDNVIRNIDVVAGRLVVGDGVGDSLTVTNDVVFDSITGTSSQQFLEGNITVGGNIVVNASGRNPQDTGGLETSALFLISAASSSPGGVDIADGLQDRLRDGTLALGADGIRLHDFSLLQLTLQGPAGGEVLEIDQTITIANSGADTFYRNASGTTTDRTIVVSMAEAAVTGLPNIHFNDIRLLDGSDFRIDEGTGVNTAVGLTLLGDATVAESTSSSGDDFDLLSVRSDVPGAARTLQVGHAGNATDTTFNTTLRGVVSSDITLDLVNATLTYDYSNPNVAIDGTVVIRDSGNLSIQAFSDGSPVYDIDTQIIIEALAANRGATTSSFTATRNADSTVNAYTANFNDVLMMPDTILQSNEGSGQATTRFNLTLAGDATVADGATSTQDPFELLGVQSNAPGMERTLFVGATGEANDLTFSTALHGVSTADVHLDVVNANLNVHATLGDIAGSVTIRDGSSVTDNSGATVAAGEMWTIDQGGELFADLTINGTLTGTGEVEGDVTNLGEVGLQGATDSLSITGDYSQDALGALLIDIAGNPGSGLFDVLTISGVAGLDGELLVSLASYVPDASDMYTILTAGTLSGSFSNALTSGERIFTTEGHSFVVNYDYVGGSVTLNNFTAVPEPGSVVLVGLAALLMAGEGWRRRKRRTAPSQGSAVSVDAAAAL